MKLKCYMTAVVEFEALVQGIMQISRVIRGGLKERTAAAPEL